MKHSVFACTIVHIGSVPILRYVGKGTPCAVLGPFPRTFSVTYKNTSKMYTASAVHVDSLFTAISDYRESRVAHSQRNFNIICNFGSTNFVTKEKYSHIR